MIIAPRLSPDGRYVAYFGRVPYAFQLLIADLSTGEERQVTHGIGELNSHPRWTADGRTLYFYQEEPAPGLRKIRRLRRAPRARHRRIRVAGAELRRGLPR
jgi:Tol biopolymer transport system component